MGKLQTSERSLSSCLVAFRNIEAVNFADLIMFMICGVVMSDVPPDSGSVAGAARVVLIALVVVIIVGFSYAVRSDFRELPKYSHFICHHKVGAATQFRLA